MHYRVREFDMNATIRSVLVGKRVILPDGRRGVIVDSDGECVLVVTPGAKCNALAGELKPDSGNPEDKETVPF